MVSKGFLRRVKVLDTCYIFLLVVASSKESGVVWIVGMAHQGTCIGSLNISSRFLKCLVEYVATRISESSCHGCTANFTTRTSLDMDSPRRSKSLFVNFLLYHCCLKDAPFFNKVVFQLINFQLLPFAACSYQLWFANNLKSRWKFSFSCRLLRSRIYW